MKYLISFLTAFQVLFAQELEMSSSQFQYVLFGGSINPIFPHKPGGDLGVGYRKFWNHLGWDIVGGCNAGGVSELIYVQNSLLYSPSSRGIYFGVGVTAGFSNYESGAGASLPPHSSITVKRGSSWNPYLNLPLTIGYQMKANKPQFVQAQMTPLLGLTISYGWGF